VAYPWLVNRQRPGPRWWLATAVASAGFGFLSLGGGGQVSISLAGMLLGLAAGGCYSMQARPGPVTGGPAHEKQIRICPEILSFVIQWFCRPGPVAANQL
jgi:hypothetical protein